MALEFPVDADAALTFFAVGDRSLLDPRRRASWEVGDVLREIIDRLVDTRAGADDLVAITGELEMVATRLRQFEHGRRYDSYGEAANASMSTTATGSGEWAEPEDAAPPSGHADFSPLLGRANPLAPPMEFSIDSSGNGYHLTLGPDAAIVPGGRFGRALDPDALRDQDGLGASATTPKSLSTRATVIGRSSVGPRHVPT
jgi:hypothetical protein